MPKSKTAARSEARAQRLSSTFLFHNDEYHDRDREVCKSCGQDTDDCECRAPGLQSSLRHLSKCPTCRRDQENCTCDDDLM